ncbi:VCBS repeat-containing protein [Cribrihabitans marinus]|uniref:VCBS repeat-containing protein n=1 Tax=Cribrihabitans marinus TaxID=1227549 RepID=A0A1H7AJ43_9RHOB|nr:Hint domain-containing protein [Cribrihabitans marinus]GGH31553.1 hypothetical protein GCM10010973_22430 [Cribrihabitans marinus]SEJ63907.1 VCBS repeat-containing protein [Cribrihabitans marinus]
MGYNIGEVSGYAGGPSDWTLTVDLTDPSATIVTGDFDVISLISGNSVGEADSYAASGFSANFGTYTNNFTLNGDGEFSFDIDRQAVFQSGVDQTVSFTITGTSGANSDDDLVTVTLLVCVAGGTLIETATGPVAVEDLAEDDLVVTRDCGLQPVRWVGCRRLGAEELRHRPELRPVRLSAGALGAGRPERDLLVSPQHRVLLSDWRAQLFYGQDEVLVPAKALVDDDRIRVDTEIRAVDYYHVLFDRHQVIRTNGAETESFHPADYTLRAIDPAARAELLALFPSLAARPGGYGPTARYVARIAEARFLATGRDGAT